MNFFLQRCCAPTRLRLTVAVVFALLAGLVNCGGGTTVLKPIEGFTVVVLPDTQCYSSNGAPYRPGSCGSPPPGSVEMLQAQTEWIAQQIDSHKIVAVIGLGDIVNAPSHDDEWRAADAAYRVLDETGIPYIPAIGNHDYDTGGDDVSGRLTSKYNQYFGVNRFTQKPWFGPNTFPAGKTENALIEFNVGEEKFGVLSLEYFPRDVAVQWASGILTADPTRQFIVVTHAYLGPDGSRGPTQWNGAPSSNGLTDGNDGEALWTKLVGQYPNIIAVVNGHAAPISGGIGAAKRVDRGVYGNLVAQMFSNYQWYKGGGSGYLRLLNIKPSKHQIVVQTYSPYLDQSLVDPADTFSVEYGGSGQ